MDTRTHTYLDRSSLWGLGVLKRVEVKSPWVPMAYISTKKIGREERGIEGGRRVGVRGAEKMRRWWRGREKRCAHYGITGTKVEG